MKILLVEPPDNPWVLGGRRLFVFEPLGLEYLAAGLSGHDVRILDMRLDPDLGAMLRAFEPHVVGFSGFTVHARVVRRLIGTVKAMLPGAKVVLGGHHATVAPGACTWPGLDAIIPGEGVEPLADLVRAWSDGGDGGDGDTVAGVRPVRDGALLDAPDRRPPPLDAYPWPRRDLTAGSRHRYFSEWMSPIASIRTSRGCPYRCDFCSLWVSAQGRYYRRAPAAVVEELKTIDSPNVFFADDESLVDHRRMGELAESILSAGLRKNYFMYGRADTVARHPELIALWRRAGMTRLFVGLEAVDDDGLGRMNKRTSVDDNVRAIECLRREGITINANFIVDPLWGPAEFDRMLGFVRRMDLDYPAFSILTPLPGTELARRTGATIAVTNTDLYDLIHPVTPPRLGWGPFYRRYLSLWQQSTPLRHRLKILRRYGLVRLPRTLVDQGILTVKALGTALGYSLGLIQRLAHDAPPLRRPPPASPSTRR